jgi:hypothetical protein
VQASEAADRLSRVQEKRLPACSTKARTSVFGERSSRATLAVAQLLSLAQTPLREQACQADVFTIATEWGMKYVAVGDIHAPTERRYKIITVWIAEGPVLRLVTAYPSKEPRT